MYARCVVGPEGRAFENYRDDQRKREQTSPPQPEPKGSRVTASPRAARGERLVSLEKDSIS